MKILVTELFLSHIPQGKESFVLQKMSQFVHEYVASKFNMSAMRAGVSVREIKNNRNGLRIFKLRINKGDRILFTFDTDRVRSEYRQAILFLDYCHHDDQAMRGRMIGVSNQQVEEYLTSEESIDEFIDQQYINFDYDPNRVITRVINVETMGQLLDEREDKAVYYLNDEQFECLAPTDAPTFIFGSAGSGKTTINIHKAFILAMQPIKIAYFTYSSYLVEDAKKLFQKILEESPEYRADELLKRVHFYHLNDYISQEVSIYQTVSYEQFRTWVIERQPLLLKQLGIGIYDIWKEIRGIIKGMIPKEWIDYRVNMNEWSLASDLVEVIVKKGLGHVDGEDLVLHAEKLYEAKTRFLDQYELKAVLLMHQILDQYLLNHALIPKEIYLKLDEQYCLYSSSQRELLYELTLRYQMFLSAEGKVDENDIARQFLNRLMNQNVPLFDFVIADEIQDLTEIQIYCLIRLARNRNNLLFSGDINQTIRPTYFHTGRIESILKTSNTHLGFIKHQLVKNYRSTKEVVDLANQVVNLRIQRLGLNKKNDYHEIPIRGEQHPIYYFDAKHPLEMVKLIETGLNRHYVAIVVPDEEEKKNFERLTQQKGAVFTVEEIKGIEKEYIICYNVMTKYKTAWETIINQDVMYQNQYRYYFNLLYVALTRARHHLCFIEEDMPPSLYEQFESEFLSFDTFDETELKLNQLSTDNQFYKEAQLYERRELYEQAITEYELSQLEEAKTDIARCRALMKNKEGHHIEAGHDLMHLKEYEKAALCYRQGHDRLNYLKALVFQELPFAQIQQEFEKEGSDVLTFVYEQDVRVTWLKRFNKLYSRHLLKQAQVIDRMIETIHELKG
ncbi:UvrD-helicase domain-containing protein [Turicibacter bilis]|uniref:UvrD-helicase domain-containing protein n=2 Tax=Turicibacter TaxID=191303 RepID=A0A9Q9CPU0_9FIRM|nr:UvrD-helicase domain-containing protein [Turicibacter bilis]MBS3198408.1 UvrD-helicase domain-containing protein [Turicibacter bilis]MBS3200416.1 UvrD-helicase domain-containing protein [Turicibacter bilis]UUF06365.1 UvrD-helicase domain-containing protein [Turicibacter bilis]UUF07598.1 UvrD-helicase domain-containing protein [Turicibacter bilis]